MEPQDKGFGIVGNPAFHSIFLKHRSRGVQHYIDAMTEEAKKSGENVMLISRNDPPKTLAGNFMLANPPVKHDPDFPLMSFNTKVVMESHPQMSFPHKEGKAVFLSPRDYDHYGSFIAQWHLKPIMDRQFQDMIWGEPSFDGMRIPGSLYDYKTQRRSGRIVVHESRQELLPQMFSKAPVAGESKPVKHNPRPSRFGFLEGLPNHKRR